MTPAATALGAHRCPTRCQYPQTQRRRNGREQETHPPERQHALLSLSPTLSSGTQDVPVDLHRRPISAQREMHAVSVALTQAFADKAVCSRQTGQGALANMGLQGCSQNGQTWRFDIHRHCILAIAIGSDWSTLFIIFVFVAVVVAIFILIIVSIVTTCCTFERSLQLACILFGKLGAEATLVDISGGWAVGAR
jgi:hypothetical protein